MKENQSSGKLQEPSDIEDVAFTDMKKRCPECARWIGIGMNRYYHVYDCSRIERKRLDPYNWVEVIRE